MSTGAEEYDPKTGTFRPIRPRPPAPPRSAATPARRELRQTKASLQEAMSDGNERAGVLYEIADSALRSPTMKWAELAAKIIIAIVFLLLLYEAVTYRLALAG